MGRLGRAAAPLFALVTCRGRWACVGGKRYTCLGCLESLASHIFYAALKMCAAEDSERPTKGSVIILEASPKNKKGDSHYDLGRRLSTRALLIALRAGLNSKVSQSALP